MKLTKEDFYKMCIWDEYAIGTARLHSSLFDKQVEIIILTEDKPVITDNMFQCLTDFLNLAPSQLPAIKEYLWEQCKICLEATSYGFEFEPEYKDMTDDVTAINYKAFGITDKESAFTKAPLDHITIHEENDTYKNRYVSLIFYPEWEDGHGCEIVLKNGIPVGWGESGVYIGAFENKE